jgi:precorrin-6B methylase 2
MWDHEQYAQVSIHRWMLRDEVRNESYRQALIHAVKPGDRVLDMGAGTGFLSILAAQAGAGKVYAVERTAIASLARRMMEKNGVAERVTVLNTDLEDADLPEKVDVLVSEWMGGLGVDENMLAPLVMARDRWLKPGGTIIPARVTAKLAPGWVQALDDSRLHWSSRPHGVDLSELAVDLGEEAHMTQMPMDVEDLLAPAQQLWTHDAYTCTLEEADRSFIAVLEFTAVRTGPLNCLLAWFDADMGGGAVLTTAVGAPQTHWGRFLFPTRHPIQIEEGARIRAELHCDPSSQGSCEFYWSIQINDGAVEKHDTRPSRASSLGL